ncbi:MAG: lamin tail domain-containing protein [Bacteroidota bacterium]
MDDDFSDGDFTNAPTWSGSNSKFAVVANELRLRAPAMTDVAYLSTASAAVSEASWEIFVRLEFNPSSTNFARFYIVADHANLSGSLNGYFVSIGDTPDEIALCKQSGTNITKIIDGRDGILNVAIVEARIKITHDGEGQWQLYTDVGAKGTYMLEGTARDVPNFSSKFAGVYCAYTSTRSDKFFFDNIKVTGDPFKDRTPPEWTTLEVISSTELRLAFSEPVEKSSAENIGNYEVSNVGQPVWAGLLPNKKTIELLFSMPFQNGIEKTLTIKNLTDSNANKIETMNKNFMYFQETPVTPKDIIITEIFADPAPRIGLPEAEYIEIFNRSINPFNLAEWELTDGGSIAHFPRHIILPGEYVIVSSQPVFMAYGKSIVLNGFPTLNNTGDNLMLKSALGVTIDSLTYTDAWYRDDDKKQGGWSLELIDPENICAEAENWIASDQSQGGTPGQQNSVFANKPDLTGPRLISAIPRSPTELVLRFDEKLEKSPLSLEVFIDPFHEITKVSFGDRSLTELKIALSTELVSEQLYSLSVSKIRDCAGNIIQENFSKVQFALPQPTDSADLVVNEILFNPRPAGIDFVEVFNRSPKYVNLKNWKVANLKDGIVVNEKLIADDDLLFLPGDYLVLTENAKILKNDYPAANENVFLELVLPAFADDEGSVVLVNDQGTIVDHFHYMESMHSPFVKDEEGVSLERMSVDAPTMNPQNWKSASSVSSFATPGYMNSNASAQSVSNEVVSVIPEIFQPLFGQPNYTQIHFNFPQGGNVANINIYDPQGRQVKNLANNEILGSEGFFRWDGDDDSGNKASVGYYMVKFEIFDVRGNVKVYRKRVAIAARF